jgi:formylmethanofuran dehydrogenase subunit E
MKREIFVIILFSCSLFCMPASKASAQTAEQWTEWGTAVHGGFGSLIAYGIRIGQDALSRLQADKRQLAVVYTDGPLAPCPCVLDGIGLAVTASLGQQTLRLEQSKTSPNLLGRVTFTHRVTQASVTYELPITALEIMQNINRDVSINLRYAAVMGLKSEQLFRIVSGAQ